MDAAFGSLKMGYYLKSEGFLFTLSMNQGTQIPWMWHFLKKGLCKQEGRVMVNSDGILASLFYDNKCHTVITNAWQSEIMEESENDDDEEEKSDNNIFGDDENEEETQSIEGIGSNNSDIEKEYEVREILGQKNDVVGVLYKTLWSDGQTSTEPFSSFVDIGQTSQIFLQFANARDWENGLKRFSQEKLKQMCAAEGKSRSMFF